MTVLRDELTPATADNTPVRLRESDPALAPLCREVEGRIARSGIASAGEIDVELLRDFSDPEGAEFTRLERNGVLGEPAVHIPPADGRPPRILVNAAVFWETAETSRRAVLAHEVAHAVRALEGKATAVVFDEEIGADRLACTWGFGPELIADRMQDYGESYAAALSRWAEPQEADEMFFRWRMQRNAGIIKPRRRPT
jgi:hypothetical protein